MRAPKPIPEWVRTRASAGAEPRPEGAARGFSLERTSAHLSRAMLAFILLIALATAQTIRVPLRSRAELFRGSGDWREVSTSEDLDPKKTALILCDLWDNHWCRGASQRVNQLVQKVAPFVGRLRQRGVLIIHAPSETMPFYENSDQRRAALALAHIAPPAALDLISPALPIDDSKGGCDTGDSFYKAWTREHPGIRIAPADLVTDRGDEVYSALRLRGINRLLVAGVHANMCILNRSFAIRQMTKWGVRCILVRDLTDSMYDPKTRPYVTHDQGTELVIEYIERYWAPTALSADILRALAP